MSGFPVYDVYRIIGHTWSGFIYDTFYFVDLTVPDDVVIFQEVVRVNPTEWVEVA